MKAAESQTSEHLGMVRSIFLNEVITVGSFEDCFAARGRALGWATTEGETVSPGGPTRVGQAKRK